MDRFIPFEKLSKKKKKERNAEKRNTWAISPVTRRPETPKAYNRKKAQNWKDDLSDSVSFSLLLPFRSLSQTAGSVRSAAARYSTGRYS